MGIKSLVSGYQYLGLGTKLEKRLARANLGSNRLEKIAKQHNIDCSFAKNLKRKADEKTIEAIMNLPDKHTMTENMTGK